VVAGQLSVEWYERRPQDSQIDWLIARVDDQTKQSGQPSVAVVVVQWKLPSPQHRIDVTLVCLHLVDRLIKYK